MKRISSLLVITTILIISTMTSCIIIPLYKKFQIDATTVSSIEIYNLRKEDTFGSGFVKTEASVYIIPKEDIVNFLYDLSEIYFSDILFITIAAMDPSFHYNSWTARINYLDGSYELISCDGYGETYSQNGEIINSHHYGCDNEEWRTLIGKYVPEDIFNHSHEAK